MAKRKGGGGKQPGAGRPRGIPNLQTVEYRRLYVRSICRKARREWYEARDIARKNGEPFTAPKPVKGSLKSAVDFLVRIRFDLLGRSVAAGEFGAALAALEGLEDRMLGRVYQPKDPRELEMKASSNDAVGDRTLVLVMGGNGNAVPVKEFGYQPAPRVLPAEAGKP